MGRRWVTVAGACALLVACSSVEPPPLASRTDTPSRSPAPVLGPTDTPAPEPTPTPTLVSERPQPPPPSLTLRSAVVVDVVDGDTIDVRLGARIERVRLIGVDTPERGQRWYADATALTRRRLQGRRVWLEHDVERRDRYGRLLAYVWREHPSSGARAQVRARMHNAALLLHGLAVLLTIPPNVAYVEDFRVFQREARANERGIWSARASGECDPSYPDVCIPPPPPDLDCGDIEHRNFRVTGSDPHRFDGDGNGRGCEG